MMPTRFPKRYLALVFAVCIGLLCLLDLFQANAEADVIDGLFDGTPTTHFYTSLRLAD